MNRGTDDEATGDIMQKKKEMPVPIQLKLASWAHRRASELGNIPLCEILLGLFAALVMSTP